MKLILIILMIAASFLECFGQENERTAFNELNTKVNNAIRTNDFPSAEELATHLVALSTKLNGATSRDTAIALINLAYSQKQQNKFEAATRNFQTAIDILETSDNLKNRDLINAYEGLAHTYFLHDKSKLAVQTYMTAVSAADKIFGAESKESYSALLNIAIIYLKNKDYSTANEFFIKSYTLALRHYGISSPEAEKVGDIRLCSAISENLSKDKNEAFYDVRKNFETSEGGGVLNGKAVSLPRPEYPSKARNARASGRVVVRVKIDEAGRVLEATPICGHSLLRDAATKAAYGAKFSPTILNGKPVRISGAITYNFSVN